MTAARNADAQHCEVGAHSLKLTSTKESGYGYWRQDVTVKKGETYTFYMYVKAEISALENVGKCFLSAQCYDKDGIAMKYDSEAVRRTTDGFLQLSVFFTVPKDAKNDTVTAFCILYCAERCKKRYGKPVSPSLPCKRNTLRSRKMQKTIR